MDSVIVSLLVYCAVRELFFMRTVDRLTNKIMARNYYDMKLSDAQATALVNHKPAAQEQEPLPDFGSLTGIGSGF